MLAKLTMPLAFLALWGCAHDVAPPTSALGAPTGREHTVSNSATASDSRPARPAETLSEADRLYGAQLGATRAGQFEVDRQVVELQRAVLLYRQFIERAAGQPDLQAAVKKSRERIEDACQTISFLLGEDATQESASTC
jgi:hypothetical protein